MTTDSIKQIDLITKFESMSNELLMELFEYYDFYSLFYSFSSLNSRIDNILHHCQVYVDLDRVQPVDFFDFLAHTLPKINPKNIQSLYASKLHQITVLAYDKSLIYFTHIRSLSLSKIQSNIVEYMVSRIDFSRLERVSFGKCESAYANTWSFFKHFLDSNRYQFLRTYKDFRNMIQEVTSVLSIEYVTSSGPSIPCDFLNFLNRSPYLKYIKTKLFFDDQYPESIFLSAIPYHNTLTHLNLELLGDVCMKTIVYLFKCVPRIYHLKLNAKSPRHPELVDPIFWETLLSKYLLKLKQLSLLTLTFVRDHSIYPIWNSLPDKEQVIQQIEKSNYWSSHQWKATFDRSMSTAQFDWAKFQVV